MGSPKNWLPLTSTEKPVTIVTDLSQVEEREKKVSTIRFVQVILLGSYKQMKMIENIAFHCIGGIG